MSLSVSGEEIPIVGVRDPRTVISGRSYAVLKGPKVDTFTPFTTTNISASNITYSVKTPSPYIFVNKYLYHMVPVRLQLNSSAPNGNNLLRAGYDAPRAFPLTQSLANISCSYNGSTVSVEIGDYFSALVRYNTDEMLRHKEYSMTPSTLDQSQNYYDLQGSNKSPLSFYGDGYGDMVGGRAGFPMNIISNTPSQAIVDFLIAEPVFVSPYYFGESSRNLGGPAFYGIQNLDFQFNFYANAWARMWSHDGTSGLNVPGPITSGQIAFNNFTTLSPIAYSYNIIQPQLLFEYLTPSEIQVIPKSISFPYNRIQRFPNDITGISPGTSFQVSTNNITLNSIPGSIYIYCRLNNQTLQSSPKWTDTFCSIDRIQINWNNHSGLLSSAQKNDLYKISVRNQCNMNWSSWSGERVYKTGDFVNKMAGVGSVLRLKPGLDIGLESMEAVGVVGTFNLQMTVNLTYQNTDAAIGAQSFTLYIVTVEEGIADIVDSQVILNVGVLTPRDVLDARANENLMDYEDMNNVGGGDFLGSLKKLGQNIYQKAKYAWNKYGRKIAPVVETFLPQAKGALNFVDKYLGEDEAREAEEGSGLVGGYRRRGGALVGGKLINKNSIMRRLA